MGRPLLSMCLTWNLFSLKHKMHLNAPAKFLIQFPQWTHIMPILGIYLPNTFTLSLQFYFPLHSIIWCGFFSYFCCCCSLWPEGNREKVWHKAIGLESQSIFTVAFYIEFQQQHKLSLAECICFLILSSAENQRRSH